MGKLIEKYSNQAEEFLTIAHQLARDKYVTSQGGNLAWRLEANLILITPTQVYKGDLKAEDLVFIDNQGQVVEGVHRPTGETPMYLTFLSKRPDILTVIHCHPPAACAIAISKGKNYLMRPLYPETTTEIGPVPVVPYAQPLTEDLAHNFEPFLPKYNCFIMENHGLVVMSRGSIQWTAGLIDLLEMTARSILMAVPAGEIKEMNRQNVIDLDIVMKKRSLPLFGLPGENDSLESLYF